MTKIHFMKHRQRFQDVAFQANSKNPIKNPYRIKNINLHSNHHWQKLLSLLLPGSTKKKNLGPGILYCNMYKIQLIIHYSSQFLTLKAETRYLFGKLKKILQR